MQSSFHLFKLKSAESKLSAIPFFLHSKLNIHTNTNANKSNEYAHLLQKCWNHQMLKQVHAQMLISRLHQDLFLRTKLIDMYFKHGSIEDAQLVFDKIQNPDIVVWNLMFRAYTHNGMWEQTLARYKTMQRTGITPDNFTFPFVLKACANLAVLQEGKQIHYDIVEVGFESHAVVGTAVIDMYGKCGSLGDARHVFDKMPQRDVFSWSSMIAGYAQNGYSKEALELFYRMQDEGVLPDYVIMVSVLQACGDLGTLRQGIGFHGYVIRHGFASDVLGDSMVAMYVKCGNMECSHKVFEEMLVKNVISWTTMIAGHAQNGQGIEALKAFNQMRLAGVKPNRVTMNVVVSACADLGSLQRANLIHDYVVRHGFESDEIVANPIIDMYAKCVRLNDARLVFDRMTHKNLVTWNTMIAGYSQNGYSNEALALFHQMQFAGIMPDSVTFVSVLSACAQAVNLQQGTWIHDYIMTIGLDSNVFVANALIDMYAKCKRLGTAHKIFNVMCNSDVVSWNVMISGYTQNGYANEALELFTEMQLMDVKPDTETMLSLLLACANLGALQQGMSIHNYVIKSGLEFDDFVETALIDMYSKCGILVLARQLFDKMLKKDFVAYSAMIAVYGMHGCGKDAVALFSEIQELGLKSNGVTFISVLSACSHSGLVDEGWQLFNSMRRVYRISPTLQHYACMVDLLGRAGCLDEALDFIEKMPIRPNVDVWRTLLGACKIHSNTAVGRCAADILFDLEPENAGSYVLLSNLYAATDRWDEVGKLRTIMKDRGLKKAPGWSSIQINKRMHSFLVGDRSHPESTEIYAMLENLTRRMKDAGYVPDMNFVLHDVG